MAAADGWEDDVPEGVGGLSFRMGDVFRDVRGLCAKGEETCGARLVDDDFLRTGFGVDVEGVACDCDCGCGCDFCMFDSLLVTVGFAP